MWQDHAQAPSAVVDAMHFSTNVFAARAIEKIKARAATDPLYIHLTWQNVHGPYTPPPEWETLQSAEFLSNYCGPTSAAAFPNDYRCNWKFAEGCGRRYEKHHGSSQSDWPLGTHIDGCV